jgi:hypothetical protein
MQLNCVYLALGEKGDRDCTLLCPARLQHSQQGPTKQVNQQTKSTKQLEKHMNKSKQTDKQTVEQTND